MADAPDNTKPPPQGASVTRREALERLAKTGLVLGAGAVATKVLYDGGGFGFAAAQGARQVRDYTLKPAIGSVDMAVARAGQVLSLAPAKPLVAKAVEAMGGMGRFVSRGDVVVIKPNIGWDRMPLHAANTSPDVVAAVVELAWEAGAKRVVVADGSCNDPHRCFQRSGIWKRAHALGAEVVLPAEHRFRTMRLKGEVLDEWPIFTTLVEADKVINVPVAKHHNLAKFTAAMKNWYGVLGGRRNRLHQSIDLSIADLATFMRPTLTVIDAMRVLIRNGPQGGNIDDTRIMNTVLASVDQVAADAYACTFIGQKAENLPYLAMAEERGIGTTKLQNLIVREVT